MSGSVLKIASMEIGLTFSPRTENPLVGCGMHGIADKCSIQSSPALVDSDLCWPRITKTKISNNRVCDIFTSSSQVEVLDITSGFLHNILSKFILI